MSVLLVESSLQVRKVGDTIPSIMFICGRVLGKLLP